MSQVWIFRPVIHASLLAMSLLGILSCGGAGSKEPEASQPSVAPSITAGSPADQSVTAGQAATFSVEVTGTEPLSFQWKKDGLDVSGGARSYTTPVTILADNNAKFSVVVTNATGQDESREATLTVTAAPVAPVITTQPANRSVTVGQTATFSVAASGTAPLTYQWTRNGINIGTNSASYTTPVTTLGDNGARYRVTATNTAGHIDSNEALLTVSAVVVAPTITTHPQNRTVTVGQTATFSVAASGTTPFTYQWTKNGSNVGTNAASYTTPVAALTDNGAKYRVVVTNTAGHANSNEATLTVNPSTGSAIIIDHTHTDLPQVPSSAITAAKNNLHIAYGHTSHGSQLVTGMNVLAQQNGSPYLWSESSTAGYLHMDDTAMGGDVGYYPDWVDNTRSYLGTPNANGRGNTRPNVNVVIWSWCGQASSRTQQQMIDTYLAPMTQLEADYPGIKFVYMTGHLDGTGTSGNLNQRNNQIRAYCQANNKILFDFADIESYDPTNAANYMALACDDGCNYDSDGNGSRDRNWATVWLGNHPSDSLAVLASQCGECAHSETLNCVLKGRAAWWLWARLAGWSGQ